MKNIKKIILSFLKKNLTSKEDQYIIELKLLIEEYLLKTKWAEGFENKYTLGDLVYVTGKSEYSIKTTYSAITKIEILHHRFEKVFLRNNYNIADVKSQVLFMFEKYVESFENFSRFYRYSLDIYNLISFDENNEVIISGNEQAQKFSDLKSKVDEFLNITNLAELNYNNSLNQYYTQRDAK